MQMEEGHSIRSSMVLLPFHQSSMRKPLIWWQYYFFSSLKNPSPPVPSGHIGGLETLTTRFPLSLLLSKSSLSGILLLVNQRKGKKSYDVSGKPPGVPSTIVQLSFLRANQAAKSSFSFWWLLRELSPEAQGKLRGDFPIVVEGRQQNGLRFLLGWLCLFLFVCFRPWFGWLSWAGCLSPFTLRPG